MWLPKRSTKTPKVHKSAEDSAACTTKPLGSQAPPPRVRVWGAIRRRPMLRCAPGAAPPRLAPARGRIPRRDCRGRPSNVSSSAAAARPKSPGFFSPRRAPAPRKSSRAIEARIRMNEAAIGESLEWVSTASYGFAFGESGFASLLEYSLALGLSAAAAERARERNQCEEQKGHYNRQSAR